MAFETGQIRLELVRDVIVNSRFILTGPPGGGKTTIVRYLAEAGFTTVSESATDAIASLQAQGIDEPWTDPSFVDVIAQMQRDRQIAVQELPEPQFFDRSPICTLALAEWLGHPVPEALDREIERLRQDRVYSVEVFFIESLGFIERSNARRMTLEDAIRFGELHEQTYLDHGYETTRIGRASTAQRAEAILQRALAQTGEC